jgi:hypothetical protein
MKRAERNLRRKERFAVRWLALLLYRMATQQSVWHPSSCLICVLSHLYKVIVSYIWILLAKSLRIFVRAGEEWCGGRTLAVALWIRQQYLSGCGKVLWLFVTISLFWDEEACLPSPRMFSESSFGQQFHHSH